MLPPLAERLRPQTLDEVVGQEALTGPGQPLRLALERPHSLLFWGPAGCGKTSLAQIIARAWQADFRSLSATAAGTKEFREIFSRAEANQLAGQPTVLFLDEIHRLNKAQQDVFLPVLESGALLLLGATTENPSFELNRALLSRLQVYRLQPLDEEALQRLLRQTLAREEFAGLRLGDEALPLLLASADGDGRQLLNLLEKLLLAARRLGQSELDADWVAAQLGQRPKRFGKGNDDFYEQISALHKAVRGSHPNAALFWLCSMLAGGADPHYLARRLVRMAWEDIGLADPRAIALAQDASQTYAQLGSPEGELALAQTVLYLAAAPKSNAGYVAFQKMQKLVAERPSPEVPLHLRNAPTALLKRFGYGRDYRYAHDEPGAYAAGVSYMPDGWAEPDFYQPSDRGLEQQIGQKLRQLKDLDEQSH